MKLLKVNPVLAVALQVDVANGVVGCVQLTVPPVNGEATAVTVGSTNLLANGAANTGAGSPSRMPVTTTSGGEPLHWKPAGAAGRLSCVNVHVFSAMTCEPVEMAALVATGVTELTAIVNAGGGKVNTNCGNTVPMQFTPYVNVPFTATGAAGGTVVTAKSIRKFADEMPACTVAPSCVKQNTARPTRLDSSRR
jgi:hypothetical protein